jgi:hypothetical protein
MLKKTVNIVEDPETGELLLDLGTELCAEMGWQVGDTVEWIDNQDGSWTLQKIKQPSLGQQAA